MKTKLYYKVIDLIPTTFHCHVFICKDYNLIINKLCRMLKEDKEIINSWFEHENKKAKIKGFTHDVITKDDVYTFIICLYNFDYDNIVHELIHLSWQLSDICNSNYGRDEELQCYFVGHWFNEIVKMKK